MRRARAVLAWAAIAAAAVVAAPGCNALLGIDPLQYRAPGSDGGPPGDGPAGGGDRPGSDAAPSATVTEACMRYIRRYCDWQSRCAQSPQPADVCVDSSLPQCDSGWEMPPGSGITPSSLDACTDGISPTTCDYASCQYPPGTISNGRACVSVRPVRQRLLHRLERGVRCLRALSPPDDRANRAMRRASRARRAPSA